MIFALRPEPGLSSTLQLAREMGLAIIGRPLFEVVPLNWEAPDPADFDALLIGSANAIRHGGEGLEGLKSLPVHAVGEATAATASEAGFTVSETGSGGLQGVIDAADPDMKFLRLAGLEHVDLTLPAEMELTTRIVYMVRALPMTGSDEVSLRASDPIVLLHSAAAARHFSAQCEERGLDKSMIALACIGPRVAAAAGTGWRACESAPQPDDPSLLALARDMCH